MAAPVGGPPHVPLPEAVLGSLRNDLGPFNFRLRTYNSLEEVSAAIKSAADELAVPSNDPTVQALRAAAAVFREAHPQSAGEAVPVAEQLTEFKKRVLKGCGGRCVHAARVRRRWGLSAGVRTCRAAVPAPRARGGARVSHSAASLSRGMVTCAVRRASCAWVRTAADYL